MPRRVTIDDVAQLAAVHKATVSRALNARTRDQVNPETFKEVEARESNAVQARRSARADV
jgi:LacI family transcriptional regulator